MGARGSLADGGMACSLWLGLGLGFWFGGSRCAVPILDEVAGDTRAACKHGQLGAVAERPLQKVYKFLPTFGRPSLISGPTFTLIGQLAPRLGQHGAQVCYGGRSRATWGA